nr:hypothetical protein [Tanacetum cinerariifolium]
MSGKTEFGIEVAEVTAVTITISVTAQSSGKVQLHSSALFIGESGVMLVIPVDPGLWSEVISRWESITINRLNNQTWSDNKAKLAFVENLFGESEKLMWQQWRTVFPEAYTALEAIADEPQNITSQVRHVYSISEGEGDSHQNISVMVQDTPVEEISFMAIKEDDESDSDQKEEYYQPSHHTFMFHPGPPTKIAEMVQAVGSWKPNKELPDKSKEC